MKQYDVTIRLRLVDLGRPAGGKGEPQPMQQVVGHAVGTFLQDLAGHTTARASQLLQLEVVDHDDLPQPAPRVCGGCEGTS